MAGGEGFQVEGDAGRVRAVLQREEERHHQRPQVVLGEIFAAAEGAKAQEGVRRGSILQADGKRRHVQRDIGEQQVTEQLHYLYHHRHAQEEGEEAVHPHKERQGGVTARGRISAGLRQEPRGQGRGQCQ